LAKQEALAKQKAEDEQRKKQGKICHAIQYRKLNTSIIELDAKKKQAESDAQTKKQAELDAKKGTLTSIYRH
jgi:hypothetical protein